MKKIAILGLIFGFLGIGFAQTIESAPGVSDPVKLNLVGSYSTDHNTFDFGYTFNEEKYIDGSKSAKPGYLVLRLVKAQSPESFSYEIFSKNGSLVSTHSIPKDTYLRLESILKQANYSNYTKTNVCFVTVEIDRSTLKLTKVSPSCDDLQ